LERKARTKNVIKDIMPKKIITPSPKIISGPHSLSLISLIIKLEKIERKKDGFQLPIQIYPKLVTFFLREERKLRKNKH